MDVIDTKVTIEEVWYIWPTRYRKENIRRHLSYLMGFVYTIGSITPYLIVHSGSSVIYSGSIAHLLWIIYSSWEAYIFGVEDTRGVSYIFWSKNLWETRIISFIFEKSLVRIFLDFESFRENLWEFLFILIFVIWSIVDMVFLIFQSKASITVRTTITISEKVWISTIIYIIRKMHCITVSRIKKLITVFTVYERQSIYRFPTLMYIGHIETVFWYIRIETQIAIF